MGCPPGTICWVIMPATYSSGCGPWAPSTSGRRPVRRAANTGPPESPEVTGKSSRKVPSLASYPLTPATEATFLVDSPVISGNSGGPVFTSRRIGKQPPLVGAQGPQPDEFIAGIVAQQIAPGGQSIALGLAVHAVYVRETLRLLDQPLPPLPPVPVAPSTNSRSAP